MQVSETGSSQNITNTVPTTTANTTNSSTVASSHSVAVNVVGSSTTAPVTQVSETIKSLYTSNNTT